MKTRCILPESTHLQLDACRVPWYLNALQIDLALILCETWFCRQKKFTSGIVKEDAEMLCIHRRKAVKIPHNAILIVTWTCPTSCLPFYVFIICCMIIAYTTDRTSSTRLCQGYNAYSTAKSKGTSTKCISLSKGGVWFRWNKWDCWLSAASLRWVKKPWIRLRLIENGRTIFDWASPAPYSAP